MSDDGSELLMFQVGARVYASAVHDVVRIGSVRDVPEDELVEGTSLGPTFGRERGIVVNDDHDGTEATLVVDQVLGVRKVGEGELHALPPFAAAVLQTSAVAGIVVFDDAPTLLVDLPTLIRERRAAAAR
ncbi:MAG TPA: chemotaxis protein CheW [Anaeromyxobacteraceae bacterium]|nr:chemotaxis protein CheW [Anaeromyxobacteraceae bacterium]